MDVIFIFNYLGDVTVDSESFLMTDFMNLRIKQSFKYAYRNRIYTHVFIKMSNHIFMSIYVISYKNTSEEKDIFFHQKLPSNPSFRTVLNTSSSNLSE
jgi:hypothetical protein